MAENDAYTRVDTEFGEVGLLAPLVPDVALLHAPVADRAGNVALHPPLLEGVWGALAARRGAIVTVERIVDDLRPWSHLVRIPAHRVLAVVEAPMGAHPGGLYAGDLPVDGYGEDYDFWVDARAATRSDDYDSWIQHWVLDVEIAGAVARTARRRTRRRAASQGRARLVAVTTRASTSPTSTRRSTLGARRGVGRALPRRADRRNSTPTRCSPAPASRTSPPGSASGSRANRGATCSSPPRSGCGATTRHPPTRSCLNHRNFPTATMLSDAQSVLGALVGGPGTTTIGCLGGAQIDRNGNVNSTWIPPKPFLVGSGGGNDVASTAAECVVVATLTPARTPERCGYVTSPGRDGARARHRPRAPREARRRARPHGRAGRARAARRIGSQRHARPAVGISTVAENVGELPAPHADEVATLRRWDPRGWFLRA